MRVWRRSILAHERRTPERRTPERGAVELRERTAHIDVFSAPSSKAHVRQPLEKTI